MRQWWGSQTDATAIRRAIHVPGCTGRLLWATVTRVRLDLSFLHPTPVLEEKLPITSSGSGPRT